MRNRAHGPAFRKIIYTTSAIEILNWLDDQEGDQNEGSFLAEEAKTKMIRVVPMVWRDHWMTDQDR